MAKSLSGWYWRLGLVSLSAMGGAIASFGDCALAQITPDGTLPNNSIVTPQGNTSLIDGGTQAGSNLFHSFEQFSVPTGGEASFNNALDIQNIISRVTGASVSNIDGLLRANGAANLFLLNPNGIIFGSNASLNIGGSFVGSTASSLNFADGTQFSATAPTTTPLLTVSVPIGLQYEGTAGGIQVQQSILQVQTGQTLALMGGDVSVEGGESGFLEALGGRIELGGLAGAGMVDIEGQQSEGAFGLTSLRFPDAVERADVLLTNSAYVDVAGGGGGSIAINARNLEVLGGVFGRSGLRAGITSGLGSPEAAAGDITLNATRAITVGQSSRIENNVNRNATGNAGNINITAGSLSLTNVATLVTLTRGQGNAGSVNINARDTVSFDDGAAFSTVLERAVGNAGGINITTGSLDVKNGAALSASTLGQGDAGNINIDARDTVSFAGVDSNGLQSTAFSTVEEGAVGNGGDINITTGSLAVTNGAALTTSTLGQGDAGNVNINARDTVSFDGGDAFSTVRSGAVGNGGDINITTGSLSLTNVAQLAASTLGQGDAGNVNINARDTVSFDGIDSNGFFVTAAFSTVAEGAVGNGGSVNIRTGSLSVTNGAKVDSSTFGQGNAGSVTITARDIVSFDGGAAFSTVEEEALGNGGSINITTGSLAVANGAQLQALTRGQGNAGSVNINARDTVFFDGVSSNEDASSALSTVEPGAVGSGGGINITAESLSLTDGAELSTSSEGNGAAGNIEVAADSIRLDNLAAVSSNTTAGQGNIFLRSRDLVLRRESFITTNAQGTATGGNITIDTDVLAALENSDITANAQEATGGRVVINTQGIFGTEFRDRLTPLSDITATSDLGPEFSGTVELNTPDVDPSQGLVTLPAELVDVTGLIAQGCSANVARGESKFTITGRGALPPNPIEPLGGGNVLTSLATLDSDTENRSGAAPATNPTRERAPTQIVEANGWMINNKGEVVLTASAPTDTLDIPWVPDSECHAPESES